MVGSSSRVTSTTSARQASREWSQAASTELSVTPSGSMNCMNRYGESSYFGVKSIRSWRGLDSEALTTFHSVKGDIVLAPGPERVGVAAQIGNYPSLEIYQDSVSGSTQQIYIDPADSGSKWGPLGNLPFDHTLGDYSSATERFDGVQPMALQEVNLAWAHGGGS